MTNRAIIVVDIQNDYFPGGKYTLTGIDAAAAKAAAVIGAAREKGDAVIHVQHIFAIPDAPFFVADTDGAQINAAVAPQQGEAVVVKNHPNSFLNTDLKSCLDQAGITDVVIIGAMSHLCIDATTRAASDFGYQTTVVQDACATRELEHQGVTVPAAQVQAAMMSSLGFAYAKIINAQDYIDG